MDSGSFKSSKMSHTDCWGLCVLGNIELESFTPLNSSQMKGAISLPNTATPREDLRPSQLLSWPVLLNPTKQMKYIRPSDTTIECNLITWISLIKHCPVQILKLNQLLQIYSSPCEAKIILQAFYVPFLKYFVFHSANACIAHNYIVSKNRHYVCTSLTGEPHNLRIYFRTSNPSWKQHLIRLEISVLSSRDEKSIHFDVLIHLVFPPGGERWGHG